MDDQDTYRLAYDDPARPRRYRRPLGQRDDPDYRKEDDDEDRDLHGPLSGDAGGDAAASGVAVPE